MVILTLLTAQDRQQMTQQFHTIMTPSCLRVIYWATVLWWSTGCAEKPVYRRMEELGETHRQKKDGRIGYR